MNRFLSDLGKVLVIGGCGTVGSLIARVLKANDVDVSILDSASDSYLKDVFKRENIPIEFNHNLAENSLDGFNSIFLAPSLLNNSNFINKLNSINHNNLAIYSVEDLLRNTNPNKYVYGISGTNGKTTTTHILKNIFKINNYTVPEHELNLQGNTEFIPSLQARLTGDIAVLEIGTFGNKGEIKLSASNSKVNTGVITNITRDHLVNGTFNDYISCKKEMMEVPDNLVLDGDDYLLNYLSAEFNKDIYFFGVKDFNNPLFNDSSSSTEDELCPVCGEKLNYAKRYLGHLGEYSCSCGFKNPNLDAYGTNIKLSSKNNMPIIQYELHIKDESGIVTLSNGALSNVYNSIAAALAAHLKGLSIEEIIKGINSFTIVKGRLELIHTKPNIIIDFAHNPSGVKSIMDTILHIKGDSKLIILNTISSESGLEGDIEIAKLLSGGDIVIPVSDIARKSAKYIDAKVINIKEDINFKKTGTIGSSPNQVKSAIELGLDIASEDDIILIIGEGGNKYSKDILNKLNI